MKLKTPKKSADLDNKKVKTEMNPIVHYQTGGNLNVNATPSDLNSFGIVGNSMKHLRHCPPGISIDFDAIATLAMQLSSTSMALISLTDPQNQGTPEWEVISALGMTPIAIPQYLSLSIIDGETAELTIIRDISGDRRFQTHAADLKLPVRFFARIPLLNATEQLFGNLCIFDPKVCQLSPQQLEALQTLSQQLVNQLVMCSQLQECVHPMAELPVTHDSADKAILSLDLEGRITQWNQGAFNLYGWTAAEALGQLAHTFLQSSFEQPLNDIQAQFQRLGYWQGVAIQSHKNGTRLSIASHWTLQRDKQQRQAIASLQVNQLLVHLPTAQPELPPSDSMRSRLTQLSQNMSQILAQSAVIPEILHQCAHTLTQHLNLAAVGIWLVDRDQKQLQLQTKIGELQSLPLPFNLENSALPLFSISTNPNPSDGTYPLILEGRWIGLLAFISNTSICDDTHSLLTWMTTSMALAIDRIWVREALQSRREALLFRLASQIRNSLDLDTILTTAVHEIRNLLQIDRCYFIWYLPHPEHPSLAITHEAQEANLPSLLSESISQQLAPLAQKVCNLEIVQVDDVTDPQVDSQTRTLLENLGMTSQLLLPLATRAGQLGGVVCSHCSGKRPWSPREVELLQAVVDQVALAIDQAELYAQTQAAALAAQTQAQQLSEALQNLKQTQTQLIQTEKMSSLGQMVAGIAHEINNPVNFITGNLTHTSNYIHDLLDLVQLYQQYYPEPVPEIREQTEAIDLEFLIDDLPKMLSSMKIGAERIRQIVLSLRNFSRLDEAEMKPVDIHEGIDNTLLILHNRIKSKGKNSGVEVIKKYGELPKVECYAGQLNQVFMNIISNAIDALENQPEPRNIIIHTEVISKQKTRIMTDEIQPLLNEKLDPAPPIPKPSHVLIRIRDTGPGMNEDVKNRLFDPFFTTKPVGKGTGLGLSISYKIVVEKHGGRLDCISKLGEGSEFCIEIPLSPPIRWKQKY